MTAPAVFGRHQKHTLWQVIQPQRPFRLAHYVTFAPHLDLNQAANRSTLEYPFTIQSFHLMYNFFRLLPVAALLSLGSAAATATPTAPAQEQQCPTYADGLIDGQAHRDNLAAAYGVGTPDYEQALNAAINNARYNARNAECPTYWRGYVQGLSN